jgi:hypothetical protein
MDCVRHFPVTSATEETIWLAASGSHEAPGKATIPAAHGKAGITLCLYRAAVHRGRHHPLHVFDCVNPAPVRSTGLPGNFPLPRKALHFRSALVGDGEAVSFPPAFLARQIFPSGRSFAGAAALRVNAPPLRSFR